MECLATETFAEEYKFTGSRKQLKQILDSINKTQANKYMDEYWLYRDGAPKSVVRQLDAEYSKSRLFPKKEKSTVATVLITALFIAIVLAFVFFGVVVFKNCIKTSVILAMILSSFLFLFAAFICGICYNFLFGKQPTQYECRIIEDVCVNKVEKMENTVTIPIITMFILKKTVRFTISAYPCTILPILVISII